MCGFSVSFIAALASHWERLAGRHVARRGGAKRRGRWRAEGEAARRRGARAAAVFELRYGTLVAASLTTSMTGHCGAKRTRAVEGAAAWGARAAAEQRASFW